MCVFVCVLRGEACGYYTREEKNHWTNKSCLIFIFCCFLMLSGWGCLHYQSLSDFVIKKIKKEPWRLAQVILIYDYRKRLDGT